MELDSRFQKRSIAFISFSFLIHISLLIALVVSADSRTDFLGSESDTVLGGISDIPGDPYENEVVEVQAAELPAPAPLPKSKPRVTAKPQILPARQKQAEPELLTFDDSDLEIQKALQAAREENVVVREEPQPLREEENLESLSPEIADTPDLVPQDESQNTVMGPDIERSESSADTNAGTGFDTSDSDTSSATQSDTGSGDSSGSGNGSGSSADAGNGEGAGESERLTIMNASQRRPLPGNPLPKYPERDRYLRHQGTTVVIGRVGTDGRVTDVQVEKSSGSRTMDQASVNEFRKWRFEPGPEVLVRKSFVFSLTGKEKVVPARLGRQSAAQH